MTHEPLLHDMIAAAKPALNDMGYDGSFSYGFYMGYVGDCTEYEKGPINATYLHRPAYTLVLNYNESPLVVAHYELDVSYCMEVSRRMREKIEDVLVTEMVALLAIYGLMRCLDLRAKGNTCTIVIPESDVKFIED